MRALGEGWMESKRKARRRRLASVARWMAGALVTIALAFQWGS